MIIMSYHPHGGDQGKYQECLHNEESYMGRLISINQY